MAKKNEQWWKAYRAVVQKFGGRSDDGYWPRAADATNAVFDALGLEKYEQPKPSD